MLWQHPGSTQLLRSAAAARCEATFMFLVVRDFLVLLVFFMVDSFVVTSRPVGSVLCDVYACDTSPTRILHPFPLLHLGEVAAMAKLKVGAPLGTATCWGGWWVITSMTAPTMLATLTPRLPKSRRRRFRVGDAHECPPQ
jgi:hypothetical protein